MISGEHITVEEIIEFLNIEKSTDRAMALGEHINNHILNCSECLEKYNSLMDLYDTVEVLCDKEDELCLDDLIFNVPSEEKSAAAETAVQI